MGLSWRINEWCGRRKVSRSQYYKLKREGRGPDTIDSGGPRITEDADRRWQEAREREAAAQVQANTTA